MNLTPHLL